jgi:hypothetical protein
MAHAVQFMDAVEVWRKLTDYEFSFRILCSEKQQHLSKAKSMHWRRRAKIKWCKLGDENTKFFHTMETYRFERTK